MKHKRKGSIKIFVAAAVISALILVLPIAIIIAEANTSALGFREISDVFSFEYRGDVMSFVVNDRANELSLSDIYSFFESKLPLYLSCVWFVL